MLGNQLSTEKKEYSVKKQKWNWKREFQIIMNIIDKKSLKYITSLALCIARKS